MSTEKKLVLPKRARRGRGKDVKPTILDVAKVAGVSKSTVSRVIQEDPRVADQTREAVQAAIAELGYVPAFSAQMMRAEPAPTIGLFLSSVEIPLFAQLNRYLHEELAAQGYHVIQNTIVNSSHENREAVMENLARMPIQGMVVSVGGAEPEQLRRFADRLPLVVVGRPDPTRSLNAIGFDEEQHARMLIDHLVALGHERIMMQGAPKDRSMGTWTRAEAQKRYAKSIGLEVCSENVFGMHGTELREWLEKTLDLGFTAITALYDRKALEVLRAANDLGIDVPGDVSVTGSDGVLDGLDLIGLTTIKKPVETVGRRAAKRIVRLVDSPDCISSPLHEYHAGELIVGRTTARPK